MAEWPSTLPTPQNIVSISTGNTNVSRATVSGRDEDRQYGDGKPDIAKIKLRLLWSEYDDFLIFFDQSLSFTGSWFSADWLELLGYDAHKAKIIGYPREVAKQGIYVDIVFTVAIQKTDWIYLSDVIWPLDSVGNTAAVEYASTDNGYTFAGYLTSGSNLQDCDEYAALANIWNSKTDMPLPARRQTAASTIDSSSYVYGGRDSANLQDCDEYTPDAWGARTDMLSPVRRRLAASTISNKGYIYGGEDASNVVQDCDEYVVDTWSPKSDIPSPARRSHVAITISGKGYIFGGFSSPYALKDCDEYTPDTWLSKDDMLLPARYYLAAFTLDSKGYVCSGYNGSDALQECDEYTASTNAWLSAQDLPLPPRYGSAAMSIDSKGYIAGGCNDSHDAILNCDEYISNIWSSKADMPLPAREYMSSTTL